MRVAGLLIGIATLSGVGGESRLTTRLEAPKGTWYIGQARPARVLIRAEEEPPTLEAPTSSDWEIVVGELEVRPIMSSGIGEHVSESNWFEYRVTLVPKRPGRVSLPPFRVSLGDRSGGTPPTVFEVKPPPGEGRPPGFLGGIGPMEVGARVEPTTVRVGARARLEVRVRGPGAFGSVARPAVSGIERGGVEVSIEAAGEQWSPRAEERIWTYELRPLGSGEVTIPPVIVSSFEPEVGRYATRATMALALRAVRPAERRSERVEDFGTEARRPWGHWWLVSLVAAVAGTIGLALSREVVMRVARSPTRFARKMARRIERAESARVVEVVEEGLRGYSRLSGIIQDGALTPEEVEVALLRSTRDGDIAARGADLVRWVDRERFSGRASRVGELRGAAVRLFERMGA